MMSTVRSACCTRVWIEKRKERALIISDKRRALIISDVDTGIPDTDTISDDKVKERFLR